MLLTDQVHDAPTTIALLKVGEDPDCQLVAELRGGADFLFDAARRSAEHYAAGDAAEKPAFKLCTDHGENNQVSPAAIGPTKQCGVHDGIEVAEGFEPRPELLRRVVALRNEVARLV